MKLRLRLFGGTMLVCAEALRREEGSAPGRHLNGSKVKPSCGLKGRRSRAAAAALFVLDRRRPGVGGAPARADTEARTDIWPWIAAGDLGPVAAAWFGKDQALPGNDAELAGTSDGWNVYVAQTSTGSGCPKSPNPGSRVTRATPQAFHVGTISMGGTVCQAELVGRRLGDYLTGTTVFSTGHK